jgi:predicted metal-dependent hydrolase
VYKAVGGREWLRRFTMNATTLLFVGGGSLVVLLSLLTDRAFYNPRTFFRSMAKLRHSPWLNREVWRHLRSYQRPDFHPDDRDTTALMEQWRAELFGADGTLSDRLPAAAAASA